MSAVSALIALATQVEDLTDRLNSRIEAIEERDHRAGLRYIEADRRFRQDWSVTARVLTFQHRHSLFESVDHPLDGVPGSRDAGGVDVLHGVSEGEEFVDKSFVGGDEFVDGVQDRVAAALRSLTQAIDETAGLVRSLQQHCSQVLVGHVADATSDTTDGAE